jgi:predicted lipoprotein|tara:strand:+ start:100 stop:435 length:336 start_codon:yes stop_codon:yes gene_type:complete
LVCLITHKSEQIACDVCENENTNEKVAIVRLDSEGERALISINLSPKMRGQRKTKGCLRDAISFFKTIYSNVRFIDAEIKSINITSQQSFLDVGFVFVKEDADVSFYEHVV